MKKRKLVVLLLSAISDVGAFQPSLHSALERRSGRPSSRRKGLVGHRPKPSLLWSTASDNNNNNNNNEQEAKDRQARALLYQAEPLLFSFPIFAAVAALLTHRTLSVSFHNFCDSVTAMAWDSSSSNKEAMDLVHTSLDGPVVTSIAILFGTLVALTIDSLLNRNTSIQRTAIRMCENIRTARVYFDTFPPPYCDRSHLALDYFVQGYFQNFWEDDMMTVVTLRRLTPRIEDCIRIIHEVSALPSDRQGAAAVGEAYNAVNQIRENQTKQMASVQLRFPGFHYANLIVLAVSICLIYLIETDPDTIDFVAEPQLSLSWALLIGTFSMLLVVIFDLSNPLGGITRIISATPDLDRVAIEQYVKRQ